MIHHSVLDDFDEVKVAVAYCNNVKVLKDFPESSDALEDLEVVYETCPGWEQSTTGVESYSDLPLNARKYIEFIERLVSKDLREVKIRYIGTGELKVVR
jgi:adenylosuccinate synthase